MKPFIFVLALLMPALNVFADDFEATRDKLNAALAADIRTADEKERDGNRKPVETLAFFGLRDDMKVVELMPGGGWYTKLLAPVLAERGEFHIALGTSRAEQALAGQPGFEKMQTTAAEARMFRDETSGELMIEADSLGLDEVDMVLTFRNYHNFGAAGRAAINALVFDALKSGGIYAVVDHTRRHMEPDSPENRRRVDPVLAITEILSAGFELVDYSDLHYRADDELRFEVGRKTVTGNSDRFTLKFRKP
jgi:predicted methyltransferase